MALSDVSNILWRERQLLELLVFKLEEEQLLLAAGRSRWLAYATREVENVLTEIKRIELERAVQVADAGRDLGLSGSPTLRELADLTPAPWDGIFAEHRRALLSLAQEIDSITKSNRELLQRGHQAAREAIASMGEIDIDAYDAARNPARSLTHTPDRRRGDLMSDFSGLRLALLTALQAQQGGNIAAGQRIHVNVNGDAVFESAGNNIFTTVTQVSQAAQNDPSQLGDLQTTLGTRTSQLQTQLAQVGSQFLRVQNVQSQNTSNGLTMKQNLSSIEDADIAEVMVNLQAQQVAYQAALEATARAFQPSLADFLK